ncbi:MAG: bifunctional precorrin-2 dehydrogenase/sirohydrochlorin ferrochelatase [Desulfuromonadaceae bacterium]|nr:bifunctional precorrin-2 dehydrogenase/sirohydrochlorin ferrochelatase [Desulfuromonadaceae bacterium]MDD5104532.1 bifunctional precorrin-2 dehydrogenase/sirohydrochlorin ferrochelatase [Desulfuromonadaceae bacterium]
MPTLALNITMAGKLAVVSGGGRIALRKIRTLLAAGASVQVVAIEICPEILALQKSGSVEVRQRGYVATDLNNAFIAIAATDDHLVNQQITADARALGILVAAADNPSAGDCTFPAVLQRGNLEIAVSTGGCCPTLASDVRDYIAEFIGSECADIVELLIKEREKLLTNGSSSTYNAHVLHSLGRRLLADLNECKESMS